MGNTLFFRARDTGKPVAFTRPDWAVEIDSEKQLTSRPHTLIEGGYWWIEVGSPMHPIRNNEEIRHEALRQFLGLWDHIKNRCEHRSRAANYALDLQSGPRRSLPESALMAPPLPQTIAEQGYATEKQHVCQCGHRSAHELHFPYSMRLGAPIVTHR
jgi:hypothetical protein